MNKNPENPILILNSLPEWTSNYFPKLNKANFKLVKLKIEEDPSLTPAVAELLKMAYEHGFNLNHLSLFLKTNLVLKLIFSFKIYARFLRNRNIPLARFIKNSINLFKDQSTEYIYNIVNDTNTCFIFLEEKNLIDLVPYRLKITNIQKLHNILSLYHQSFLKANHNFSLNLEESFSQLNLIKNQKVPLDPPLTIKIPQSSYELCLWGSLMKNCVSNYGTACANKKTIILGIFDHKEELIINLEIYNKKIKQIFKKNNTLVATELREAIASFLLSHHIIDSSETYFSEDLLSEFEALLDRDNPALN